jgi:hypothetical protein
MLLSSEVKTQVEASNTKYGKFGDYKKMSEEKIDDRISVENVYNELIHLRQYNKVLGDRI